MILATSAILAVLFDEPERAAFVRAIAAAPTRSVSAATALEAALVVEARRGEGAGRQLDLLLHRARVRSAPVDEHQVELAREAWRRYGMGRHPAGLNFGDLFSYALARSTGEPLLFTGDHFGRTDVVPAVGVGAKESDSGTGRPES